jgi:hypothetical protein
MSHHKWRYPIVAILAIAVVGAAFWFWKVHNAATTAQGCTQEAKICPDGSAVERTGPNCTFAACPGPDTSMATSTPVVLNSGVQGTVSLGPTCPVEQNPPSPGCGDKPYATAIVVYHASSNTVVMVGDSDLKGVFRFSLPPGSYTLQATSGTTLPHCAAVTVQVPSNSYASTTLSCDTGIR